MNGKPQRVSELARQLGDLPALHRRLGDDPAARLPGLMSRAVVAGPAGPDTAEERARRERVASALRSGATAVRRLVEEGTGAALGREELEGLEAVVALEGRPALLVRNDDFGEPPDPWKVLDERRAPIREVLPRVGRIERGPQCLGTGFVVGPGLVMTNRHVAEYFCSRGADGWSLTVAAEPGIDFRGEHRVATRARVPIVELVGIHDAVDLALFRIDAASLPVKEALWVASAEPAGLAARRVYVVGYPTTDNSRRTPPQVLLDIFGEERGVKRLQPGEVTSAQPFAGAITHDCSTLGGNSGSCVVDLDTGLVLGLHFKGYYQEANHAVALWLLAGDALLKGAKVQFD